MAVAKERDAAHEVVLYLKHPLTRAQLEHVVSVLEDPVEDLVRKDSHFAKLGLDPEHFVGNADAVVDILVAHPKLLQRPLLVRTEPNGDRAIIGRPKDRVVEFFG